jgi:hypothetical protein
MPFLIAYEGALILDEDVDIARDRAMTLINNEAGVPLCIYQVTMVRKLIPPPAEVPPTPRLA